MKILMIAYYFPPDSSSGSFRPLVFARHLQKMGEDVCILTAREQDYLPDQPKDYNLLEGTNETIEIFRSRVFRPREALLGFRDRLFGKTNKLQSSYTTSGSSVNIYRTGQLRGGKKSWFQQSKDAITDCLSMPDAHIGWLPSSIKEGLKIIKNRDIEVIYATGGPWTGMLIGTILKKLTGRSLIIDFRDPWVANPFTLKGKFFRWIESFMEREVIAIANYVITNTEELRQDFLRRYPLLAEEKVTTIPNGFEEYLDSHEYNDNGKLILTHAGTLYFSRTPRFLLQAVINVIEKNIIPKEDIHLVFLGGISIYEPDLENLLQHPLLQNVVEILPRLPYQETIQYQKNSDILFLIQPDFPLQVPRKLYEYMAFRKPILGITDLHGATPRVIRENDLGIVVENQTAKLEAALRTSYEKWKEGTLNAPSMQKCDKFMNKNLTSKLLKIFRECNDMQ